MKKQKRQVSQSEAMKTRWKRRIVMENEELKWMMGISENTHDLTIAVGKAQTALTYTVALRDKLLEAYKEIMQIQI